MFDVLFEDNHLLVVSKPAGLPTMGVAADRPSLIEEAKSYIRQKYEKPGNVFLGVVSRLDTPVTGVVVLARTSKAASRLSAAFRERRVKKQYWAVVESPPEPPDGCCEDWLRRDERHRKVHITRAPGDDAQWARLTYRTQRRLQGDRALLEVALETGRKHQIRVQLASRGWPILGDRKYRAQSKFPLGIALHARCLRLEHPVRKTELELVAELPPSWHSLGLRG